MSDFDSKMVDTIFEIMSISTVAKNYTSNFSDTPFGPYHSPPHSAPTLLEPIFSLLSQLLVKNRKF